MTTIDQRIQELEATRKGLMAARASLQMQVENLSSEFDAFSDACFALAKTIRAETIEECQIVFNKSLDRIKASLLTGAK